MSLHRSFNDPDAVRLLLDCMGALIRDQVELALEKKLPQYLSTERRPPRAAGGSPAEQAPDDHYVTRAKAAEITGYSERTITRLIDSGKLKVCGPRRNRITRFEIDRMMEEKAERKRKGEPDVEVDADADVDSELARIRGEK